MGTCVWPREFGGRGAVKTTEGRMVVVVGGGENQEMNATDFRSEL